MSAVKSQLFPLKNASTGGIDFRRTPWPSTHGRKQTGMAAISSSTTDPGSALPRILSAAPQSQTDSPRPSTIPAT
ncbi:MAG: hypothetical protein DME25_10040 [Verrucomicrobia bacterium]|nr:MAG: hypothetical protein DME25_10040 [Verrucomicrobiota bacterium]